MPSLIDSCTVNYEGMFSLTTARIQSFPLLPEDEGYEVCCLSILQMVAVPISVEPTYKNTDVEDQSFEIKG